MFISVVELFHQPIFDNVTSSSALVMWQSPGGNVDKYIVQYVLAHMDVTVAALMNQMLRTSL